MISFETELHGASLTLTVVMHLNSFRVTLVCLAKVLKNLGENGVRNAAKLHRRRGLSSILLMAYRTYSGESECHQFN